MYGNRNQDTLYDSYNSLMTLGPQTHISEVQSLLTSDEPTVAEQIIVMSQAYGISQWKARAAVFNEVKQQRVPNLIYAFDMEKDLIAGRIPN